MASNNTSAVAVGKPKINGAIFNAPLGTTLPTDATSTLNSAFKCVGYVSEDGVRNNYAVESSDVKAWGGDTVYTAQTSKDDGFGFKLLQVLDLDVLKAVYGGDNVTGALATGITVRVNSSEVLASAWVIDMIMNGALKRIVIPNAKISEIAEIVYKDDEPVGYDITLKALPGDTNFGNDTHKEYIIKASSGTSGSGSGSGSGS